MISDADAEKALDWLIENAARAAKARATRLYLESFLKSKRALLMGHSNAKTAVDREADAYAHPEYLALLQDYRDAVGEDERLRWLQTAAETKLDVWRTASANNRAQGKVT